ncbi:hypothetical protein PRJ_1991 [Pseudomonas sp. XWY-1]|nr:hypothetical protein PRJ_1991 [Pseudomonas sp. XWY-1]
MFLWCSPRTWPVVTSCTAKTVGDPNQHASYRKRARRRELEARRKFFTAWYCSAKERSRLASRKREGSVQGAS